MASFDYNPITGNLDLVGSGASYIDGDVEYHSQLPVSVGSPAVNSAFLVRKGEGLYFISRKPAGIWVRELNNGNLDDWKYAGTFSDLYRDSNFRIIADTDTSKQVAFNVGAITTNTTRTLTVPDSSGTIARTEDFSAGTSIRSEYLNISDGEQEDYILFTSGTGVEFFGNRASQFRSALGLGTAATQSFASPPAIGSTTRNTGAFTTLSANNGTLTSASAPVLDLSQTWNNAAVTFTGLRANFTNTASATASRLIDLQLGGTSQFYVERGGTIVGNVTNASTLLTSAVNFVAFDVAAPSGGRIRFAGSGLGSQPMSFWTTSGAYRFGPDANTASTTTGFWLDTEGTSNVLALRNGTSAQTFRLYNTFTDASNYERAKIAWSSNVLQIGTEKAGTGSARALEFQTDGTTRFTIATNGQILCSSSLSVVSNLVFQGNAAIVGNISSGVLRLLDGGGSSFNRLQFGGGTASFPSIKRDSTVLQARLANDSDFCPLQGQLRTHANAVSETITATHTLTLFDAAGTAYKVPCVAA